MMNVEKLKRLQTQVRIGGKGTPRRKKKVMHQTAAADDKKLQSSLKKLSVSTIPGIEEVNIIKDDLTVIHFNNPKAQASLSANTFAVTGHGETKKVVEMLPEILPQLGQETVAQLRTFASSMTSNQKTDASGEEKIKSNVFINDDDDDVPMLVSDFDEIAKGENLITGKLKIKSHKNIPIAENSLKSNVAQDMMLKIINNNDGTNKLNSDVHSEENTITDISKRLNVEVDDRTVLVIQSGNNKCQNEIKESLKFENNKDSLTDDKKPITQPVAEKKEKSSKQNFDSKKRTGTLKVDNNEQDEVVLSELKQTNPIDFNTEVDLQDLSDRKQSIEELKEDIVIYDYIAPMAENEKQELSEKILDTVSNINVKENVEENIKAEKTIVINESLNQNVELDIEPTKSIKELKEDIVIYDDIAPIAENEKQKLSEKILDTASKINIREIAKENIEAEKATVINESLDHNVNLEIEPMIKEESCTTNSISFKLNKEQDKDLLEVIKLDMKLNLTSEKEEPQEELQGKSASTKIKAHVSSELITKEANQINEKSFASFAPVSQESNQHAGDVKSTDKNMIAQNISNLILPIDIDDPSHTREVDVNPISLMEQNNFLIQTLEEPLITNSKLTDIIDMKENLNTENLITNRDTNITYEEKEIQQKFPEEIAVINFPQVTKKEEHEIKDFAIENKIPNEIQGIEILKSPGEAVCNLATVLQVTNTEDFETKDVIKENKQGNKLDATSNFMMFSQVTKTEDRVPKENKIQTVIQGIEMLLKTPGESDSNLPTFLQDTNTEDFQRNAVAKENKQDGTSNIMTLSQVTKTVDEQTNQVANENKIHTEIQEIEMLLNSPRDSNLETFVQVANTEDFQTKGVTKENKQDETSNLIALSQFTKTEDEQTKKVEKENKTQTEIQGIEMLLKSPEAIFQTKDDATKVLMSDLPTTDDSIKNEIKSNNINKNETNHELLKIQNLSVGIPLKTDIEQKPQQTDELKNNETSLALGQYKEKGNNLDECSATKEHGIDQDVVKLLGADGSKGIDVSERQLENRNASLNPDRNDCAKAAKATTNQNDTKKKSLSGTTTKTSVDPKKTGKSKQTKNQIHQSLENKTTVPNVQKLIKSTPSSGVKPEKQTDAQKSKQQRTGSPKTQNTTEVKSGNPTQPPTKQKILASTKSSTADVPTNSATSETVLYQPIIQTPVGVEIPKKSKTSTEVIKTATKKNATETAIKVRNKSDQISAPMETSQKQANIKAKHPQPPTAKADTISKPLSLPKPKPSQKSAVNSNKNT